MNETTADDTPRPGRRVHLEPTPPGFWRVLIGLAVGLLAPFFGILFGSGMGVEDDLNRMNPLYWGFFIGGLIGTVGLVVAALGAMALVRHTRTRNQAEDAENARAEDARVEHAAAPIEDR